MKYLLELQEIPESKALLEQLKTLKYVKMKKVSKDFQSETEVGGVITKFGRAGRGYWKYSVKQVASTV